MVERARLELDVRQQRARSSGTRFTTIAGTGDHQGCSADIPDRGTGLLLALKLRASGYERLVAIHHPAINRRLGFAGQVR